MCLGLLYFAMTLRLGDMPAVEPDAPAHNLTVRGSKRPKHLPGTIDVLLTSFFQFRISGFFGCPFRHQLFHMSMDVHCGLLIAVVFSRQFVFLEGDAMAAVLNS